MKHIWSVSMMLAITPALAMVPPKNDEAVSAAFEKSVGDADCVACILYGMAQGFARRPLAVRR